MIDSALVAHVQRLISHAVEREILPRFGQLSDRDVAQKETGELVTTADLRAEELLSSGLRELVPGSTVVGEEAASDDPAVLLGIGGTAPVWIVDPIDGTENFAAGSPRFTVVVALAVGGAVQMSWVVAPLLDLAAVAIAGGGASINEVPVRASITTGQLRHLDVSAPQPKWWSPAQRRMFNALSAQGVALCFFDAAGMEYLELAAGRRSATVLTWEHPWDHAAGMLLHSEAGGVSLTADGQPFRLVGGNALPMVVAGSTATAAALQAALGSGDRRVATG